MIKFFACKKCGDNAKVVTEAELQNGFNREDMEEVIPNTRDASLEKHVPVVSVNGNKVNVSVGEAIHPMKDDHFINWILLETDKGTKKVELTPNDEPTAAFELSTGEKPLAVYEYCNLHGLWKKDI